MIEINATLALLPICGWSYEQAFCTNHVLCIRPYYPHAGAMDHESLMVDYHRDTKTVDDAHKSIAEALGARQDNKQTFKLKSIEGEGELYITFHDGNMYVGTGIRSYSPWAKFDENNPDYPKK